MATLKVTQGATANIPANAPHQFRNTSGETVHMLCMCTPAGQEEFFDQVGDRVGSRTSAPPQLSKEEQTERGNRSAELAPKYRTEMLRGANSSSGSARGKRLWPASFHGHERQWPR